MNESELLTCRRIRPLRKAHSTRLQSGRGAIRTLPSLELELGLPGEAAAAAACANKTLAKTVSVLAVDQVGESSATNSASLAHPGLSLDLDGANRSMAAEEREM